MSSGVCLPQDAPTPPKARHNAAKLSSFQTKCWANIPSIWISTGVFRMPQPAQPVAVPPRGGVVGDMRSGRVLLIHNPIGFVLKTILHWHPQAQIVGHPLTRSLGKQWWGIGWAKTSWAEIYAEENLKSGEITTVFCLQLVSREYQNGVTMGKKTISKMFSFKVTWAWNSLEKSGCLCEWTPMWTPVSCLLINSGSDWCNLALKANPQLHRMVGLCFFKKKTWKM